MNTNTFPRRSLINDVTLVRGKTLRRVNHCGNYQKFLWQIRKIFVTLGLKILRVLKQKVAFEANFIKG